MKSFINGLKDKPALVLCMLCDCVWDTLASPHVKLNFELSAKLFLLNYFFKQVLPWWPRCTCLFEAQHLCLMDCVVQQLCLVCRVQRVVSKKEGEP